MVDADGHVQVFNQRMLDMLELPRPLMEERPTFEQVATYQREKGEFASLEVQVAGRVGQGTVMTEAQTYERRRPNGRDRGSSRRFRSQGAGWSGRIPTSPTAGHRRSASATSRCMTA